MPKEEKKSSEFSGLLGVDNLVAVRTLLPDEGADRTPAACAAGAGAAATKGELPLDGAVRGTAADDDDEAEDMPPPPNLAAMRARASSRRRVWRIMYCSSDSPVKRSMPFRSSCGNPGASPLVGALGAGGMAVGTGAGAGMEAEGVLSE